MGAPAFGAGAMPAGEQDVALNMSTKIRIKNSVIILAQSGDGLREQLLEFDIADKTPLDCMDFLRKLKELYGKKKV